MPENHFGYDKMLDIEHGHNPPDNELNVLAEYMTKPPVRIPAGYTYLGQFINHDISLDSAAANKVSPWEPIAATSISNLRSPFLNLETLYGSENPAEPSIEGLLEENSYSILKLGETVKGFVNETYLNDLPRIKGGPKALIVDQRNDENLAVAQTQVAFIKFHNTVSSRLGGSDSKARFFEARKIVVRHYQWIVLKDYLPRIVKESVLNDVITRGNQFYFPNPTNPYMPLEFSVAAFRTGHSMIRESYNWNRLNNEDPNPLAEPAELFHLMKFTSKGGGITENLPSDWIINWNWFYEIEDVVSPRGKFNFASPIDTKLAPSLKGAPIFVREASLAAHDLYRARALGLPSGQETAKRILGTSEEILKPEQIANLLPDNLKYAFSKETPLWFYLLAEAEIEEGGRTLGEVGSRIVAETFVSLLRLEKASILEGDFQPDPVFCDQGVFGMRAMLKFIAKNNKIYDELNPIG